MKNNLKQNIRNLSKVGKVLLFIITPLFSSIIIFTITNNLKLTWISTGIICAFCYSFIFGKG